MTDSRRAAAAMIGVGFYDSTVTPGIQKLINMGIGSVVLFARNIPDPGKVRELTGALKSVRSSPLTLCVDQEGGRVQRFRAPYTEVPAMRYIGATNDVTVAAAAGTVLGCEMRFAGFDVDFAPSVDVDTNPANPVIATRSFGASPDLVSRMGTALITALQAQGVAACAKHFPGHGDTSQDSHKHLPRLDHNLARLESVELPPFKAAIEAGVASIMSAHVIFSPLDPTYPATMSPQSLGGILRDRFAYNGVVFSDDLEMKALADHFTLEDQLLRGTAAGIDQFLICHDEALQHKAVEILAHAIDTGHIPQPQVTATLNRLATLTKTYVKPLPPGTLEDLQSHPTHRAAVAKLAAVPISTPMAAAAIDPTKFK